MVLLHNAAIINKLEHLMTVAYKCVEGWIWYRLFTICHFVLLFSAGFAVSFGFAVKCHFTT